MPWIDDKTYWEDPEMEFKESFRKGEATEQECSRCGNMMYDMRVEGTKQVCIMCVEEERKVLEERYKAAIDIDQLALIKKRDKWLLIKWALKHDEITPSKGAELVGLPLREFKIMIEVMF